MHEAFVRNTPGLSRNIIEDFFVPVIFMQARVQAH
jgi:hypothetical protein